MSSKKSNRELRKFRQFVDGHLPGGASHMSDPDLANLRDLVDTGRRPEVAQGLIQEMDTLLQSDDTLIEKWMAESAATGINFNSPAEARSYLREFRTILAGSQDGGSA